MPGSCQVWECSGFSVYTLSVLFPKCLSPDVFQISYFSSIELHLVCGLQRKRIPCLSLDTTELPYYSDLMAFCFTWRYGAQSLTEMTRETRSVSSPSNGSLQKRRTKYQVTFRSLFISLPGFSLISNTARFKDYLQNMSHLFSSVSFTCQSLFWGRKS